MMNPLRRFVQQSHIEIYDQLWVLDVLHDVLGLNVAILTSFTRLTIMVGCLSLVD